ncbi:AraC family transcriptional regulator [Parabacteroides sp. PF5-5]|uniref:AraC family transcriptional regulator n=1 Tax=unclassified Parabacteroides TaxID=2649774 RepID=UPI002473D93A|nr:MULTISPECIES: GyrI-like domain-containing protein [unclassified Parabacteroides]MDH6304053.1 AraC family transcriptional regulator [Parabacteroides sp. PH5-39]MDH6315144.1 AraC family transcriptional regulator [Parabacteroides sp. PF5-13]MDH6318892.1 AraC family transcriptional regulator [Parabacteroides sp. PH5-13]MDH6322621.1 AraC family transcriptional regulator [Parabacteroides sp. PH5-8]MDH6326330.1 AraC family transcriptional regulator [Parabacteroides sp. PH5-41]
MNYKAQIDAVLHYINSQIQRDWSKEPENTFNNATSIAKLMDIACLSKRNFQLVFKEYIGETAGEYIDRIRMEYGVLLLKENRYSNKEIAERLGWANDTAFYNAFKKRNLQSPTKYKAERFELNTYVEFDKVDYTLIELPETPIIFFLYNGSYDDYTTDFFEEESWERLRQYAQQNDWLPEKEEYWGVCYDDRDITIDNKCRFYAGLTVNHLPKMKVTDEIKSMYFPKEKYAVYIHKGPYEELDSFYNAILHQIPDGYNLSDGLILERYLNSVTDTLEEGLLTEILLPITKKLL